MLKNVGSNMALVVIQILVLIQLTPVTVRALGMEVQGVWLTIASMSTILNLLIMGVPMASVRFVTQHVARKDMAKANEAIASCLGICMVLGVVAMILGAGLGFIFEHTYLRSPEWEALGPRVLHEARLAYWFVVAQVGIGFIAQLPYGILDAHHDFVSRNAVKIAGLMVRLGITIAVLRAYPSLLVLASIQGGVMVMEFTVSMVLIRKRWPEIRFGLAGFDRVLVREILGFSVYAMLLNIGSQLAFQTDQMVIAANENPGQNTLFDVGNKFFPPLTAVVLSIGMVIMPTAAKLQATDQLKELKHVFLKWSKAAYSCVLLVGIFLIVYGPDFICWWMGPDYVVPSGQITRTLIIGFLVFLPARGVASPMLMGLGKPVGTSILFVTMGVVNLAISLVLVKPYGILGVAIGTAIPCVVFALILIGMASREAEIPMTHYLRYVFLRPTAGALPAVAFLLLLKVGLHVEVTTWKTLAGFIRLLASGIGMVVMFSLAWVLFVYRGDPYVDLFAKVQRFLPRPLRRKPE